MKFKPHHYNRLTAGELYHFGFGFENSRRYRSLIPTASEENDFQYVMNKFSNE